MIYAIVGTEKDIRENAYLELKKHGAVTVHIYSEQVDGLEALVSASNLFGDTVVVNVIQCMGTASGDAEVTRLFPAMKESLNIFIIDEPFADANRIKKLSKYAERVFNAVEEKSEGVNLFTLCDLFSRRDKKGAWIEWMKIRDKESGEAIQGVLWWKFQTIWSDVRTGRSSKFTLFECEMIGSTLLRSSILAHRGEVDLKVELEKVLLSL